MKASKPFWTQPLDAAFVELTSSAGGLAASEAVGRLAAYGPNADAPPRKAHCSLRSPAVFWSAARLALADAA
jgi:Cation transporter/ATPase, N-terminus